MRATRHLNRNIKVVGAPIAFVTWMFACSVFAYAESVPLQQVGGTFVVKVLINDTIRLDFTIDSGAAEVSIPADVFSTLIRTGTVESSDVLESAEYRLADGSVQTFQRFRIRSLRIGDHNIDGVIAIVVPHAGSLLLGQSFLSRLDAWSIDNERQLLVMPKLDHGAVQRTEPKPSIAEDESNWELAARSEDLTVIMIVEKSTIRVAGEIRHAWFKEIHKDIALKRPNAVRKLEYIMNRIAFNCVEKTYVRELVVWYYADGTNEQSTSATMGTSWEPVVPDSVLSIATDFICEWKDH